MRTREFFTNLNQAIWGPPLETVPRWKARILKPLRIAIALVRDWWRGDLGMRATSLVYSTLLSMVPLLAFAFSVVTAFGVQNIIAPVLNNLLAPLGSQGMEIARRVIDFVQSVNVGVLGSVGLIFLIYTALSLLGQVEDSLNFVWRVKEARTLSQRFSEYLSVLLVGPVIVISALGLTASAGQTQVIRWVLSVKVIGTIAAFVGSIIPYLLVIGSFTFIFVSLPNARVRLSSALWGGIVAGTLWKLASWMFTLLVVSSTQYAAIYSSFAILIMFFIWLYIGWMILLLGASVSFYSQHPEYLPIGTKALKMSARVREKLALTLMYLVGRRYRNGDIPWTVEDLSVYGNIPGEPIVEVMNRLEAGGLVLQTGSEPPAFVPGRPLDTICIRDVLRIIRSAEEIGGIDFDQFEANEELDLIVSRVEHAVNDVLGDRTIDDLIVSENINERNG